MVTGITSDIGLGFDYDIINRTYATVAGNIKLYVSFPKSGFYTPDLPGLGQEYFHSTRSEVVIC